ncbi:hypothetical protein [Rubrivivax gelatinosus]|uniref:Uncharacterized protein n=1 Tax=Rubrivivax gelatinosus TaxID=28068 RepID=A0ABS1E0E1_RUBGE|nr:hypothetical protein [Rubrivivax gelatinosus]MBK1714405.1 hypothetical protein [Rubrivivax gelatinosus]
MKITIPAPALRNTLVLATMLAAAGAASAHDGGGSDHPPDPLAKSVMNVRRATAAFQDVEAAKAAGYAQFLDCTADSAGAMGVHYLNGTLVDTTMADPLHPEALTYEPQADGSLKLVGVEYIVFQDSWDAANAQPPTLFGHPFHLVRSPNRYGVPSFYELHFWVWRANKLGLFADWNPDVRCPTAAAN